MFSTKKKKKKKKKGHITTVFIVAINCYHLTYDVSYKTLIGTKPLRIMFDKVDGFIRDYGGTKLFDLEKYDTTYDRIIIYKI